MDLSNADRQSSVSLADVTTKPYTPDGGLHASGLALTAVAGTICGLAAGVVFGVISQWFYAIILFPIVIGLAIGSAQKFVIQKTKLRNTMACGAVGLLAGLIAVVTMHYVDYQAFRMYKAEADAEIDSFRQAVRQGILTQAEFDQALREYENDPEVKAMRAIDSFPTYIDWAAQQGVELTGSRSSAAINLGYVGTYVYWGVDALIIAAMVVVMTRIQAAEPFCEKCDRWKESVEMGRLPMAAKPVAAALASGRLSTLNDLTSSPSRSTAITAYICTNCQNTDDVVLQVSEVSYPNGKEHLEDKGRFVCDATAIDELTKLFDAGETTEADNTTAAGEPIDEETEQLLAAANSAYSHS